MIEITQSVRRQNILVVDDEEINREILSAQLMSQGYWPVHAQDGADALKAIASNSIDLVLTDIVMPVMDGYELCKRIRDDPRHLDLPIIFVTTLHDRESRVRGKEVGCDEFLSKPVDSIELSARVKNLLRVKAYHDLRAKQKELLEEELERTRDQLLRADRMATLGTLAAGVGHELNNILSVLQMTVDLIRMKPAPAPVSASDLKRLDTVVEHIGIHARQLLNFGRPGPQIVEKLDLRDIVKQTVEMLRVAGKLKYVELESTIAATPVIVETNRTRIEQVLVNLLGNAVDAMAENAGRPKRVRVSLQIRDGLAACEISDTGCGIPPDKLEAVFAPYYTTKPVGKGTGLGLAVVKQIVESHPGGKISIQSTVGQGTTVCFELPIVAK